MTKRNLITHSDLLSWLKYDPLTGIWVWIKSGPKKKIGKRAGHLCKTNGYWIVRVNGTKYLSARLAWFYMTGEWPPLKVDHENLNKIDDRWENIRSATNSQNGANTPICKANTSGMKGVRLYRRTGRYSAQIKVNLRYIHLGYFDTKEDAGAAYKAASEKYFGSFARQA